MSSFISVILYLVLAPFVGGLLEGRGPHHHRADAGAG